jgi:hypothetical protein
MVITRCVIIDIFVGHRSGVLSHRVYHGWHTRDGESTTDLDKYTMMTPNCDEDKLLSAQLYAYLEEHFNAIYEEEDDYNKHENSVASIEDMSVEMPVFVADPDK